MNNQNFIISYGDSVFNNQMSTSTLNDVISKIKTDPGLAGLINQVRAIVDKKERQKFKVGHLPYFNLGLFKDDIRRNNQLASTQYMIIDLDGLSDEQLKEVKSLLDNDTKVFMYFLSPSGNGYKVAYKFQEPITEYEKYNDNYVFYAHKLWSDYINEIDAKTKDASRPCFFSYDPDIYVNENAECLPLLDEFENERTIDLSKIDTSDKDFIPEAVKYLSDKIDDYDDWMRAGMALASLGERGRAYFHELSSNPIHKDTPDDVDKKFDNFLSTASGKIQLPTLFEIAKKYGFTYSASAQPTTTPGSSEPFHETLLKRFEFDDQRDLNEPMGYRLSQFSTIMKELDGLQMGYYHLGADSNVGKTALMHNLALDLIANNDDLKVLFFSQDDPKLYASYRLIALLGGLEIQDSKRGMGSLKNDQLRSANLKEAREKYVELLKTERLVLKDTADLYQLDELEEVVRTYYEKNKKIVVIIDGLYNLEVNSSKEGIRVENIERAKRIKRIVDTYQIPLITTGELRKKQAGDKSKNPKQDDLMESGKFAYNANIVWLLYAADSTMANATEVKINLDYAKNKISGFKGTQQLTFVRAEGKMYEGWSSFEVVTEEEEV